MEDSKYNYIIDVLNNDKIIGSNFKEKQSITKIREIYRYKKVGKDSHNLKKNVSERWRIVPRKGEMKNLLYQHHDSNSHCSKAATINSLSGYFWDTKIIDIEIYLSSCKHCGSKYELTKNQLEKIRNLENPQERLTQFDSYSDSSINEDSSEDEVKHINKDEKKVKSKLRKIKSNKKVVENDSETDCSSDEDAYSKKRIKTNVKSIKPNNPIFSDDDNSVDSDN